MSDLRKQDSGAEYLSSREASKIYKVTSDYLARLCRQGKLDGILEGRTWFISSKSLEGFFGPVAVIPQVAQREESMRVVRRLASAEEPAPALQKSAAISTAAVTTVFPQELREHRLPVVTARPPRLPVILRGAVLALLLLVTAAIGSGQLMNTSPSIAERALQQFATAGSIGNIFAGASNTARVIASAVDSAIYDLFYSRDTTDTSNRNVPAPRRIAQIPATMTPARNSVVSVPQSVVAPRTTVAAPTTVINQPVIERVIETQRVVTAGSVSEAFLNQNLNALENKLRSLIYASTASSAAGNATTYQVVAHTNKIDLLGGVGITSSTFSNGSISNSSISGGTISGATLASPTITGTTTITTLVLSGSATTTAINGFDISDGCFAIDGTCITGSGGSGTPGGADSEIQFNFGGSFGGKSTFTFASSTNTFAVTNSSTTNATSTTLFATYASTTNLFANVVRGAGLTSCSALGEKILYDSTLGQFVCGADQSGGGSDSSWNFFNNSGIRVATTTNQVLIGGIATSTTAKLQVIGGAVIDSATSTAFNTNFLGIGGTNYFTSLTGNGLTNTAGVLTVDQGAAFSTTSVAYWDSTQARWATTSSDYWKSVNNFFSTTSASTFLSLNQGQAFSTTSASHFSSLGLAFSTTSSAYFLSQNGGSAFSTTSANFYANASTTIPKTYSNNTFTGTNGFQNITATGATSTTLSTSIASTSLLVVSNLSNALLNTSANGTVQATSFSGPLSFTGGTLTITQANASQAGYLAAADWTSFNSRLSTSSLGLIDKGYFFSTTSALAFSASGLSFSTTSTDYWKSQNNFFSTTSASAFLALNQGNAFSTTSANVWSSFGLGHSTTSTAYQLSQNVALGNATSTTLFATTASSTNLFSNASLFGSSTIGSLTTVGTTTGSNGFNIAAGCFAINGTCLVSGSSILGSNNTWTGTNTFNGNVTLTNATSTTLNTTILGLGGTNYFTSLTGNGLTNTAGVLTVHQGQAFSTTSTAYWDSTQFRWATTSASYFLSQNQGNAFSTTSATFFASTGLAFSTTSTDYWKSVNNFFSTTSASHFSSLGLAFSTTSASYFLSQNQGNAFSTTSATFFASTGLAFSTTSAIHFVHSSTTIPKTYTTNTFTGTNGFQNITATGATSTTFFSTTASSTNFFSNTATIGSLTTGSLTLASGGTGFAQLVSGALTSSSTLSVTYGGTGSTTLSGLLKGNGAGALQTAIAGIDYENALTFTYPLTRSTNTIALGFGTTTANTWSSLQTFSTFTATAGTSTALFATTASSTNLFSNTSLFGSSTIGVLTTVGTTTGSNGFNIAAGCFAINGVCATSGSGAAWPFTPGTSYNAAVQSTSTPLALTSGIFASSTSHFVNVDFDAATSTAFFATTASSTNLFSNTATIGSLTAGALSLGNALTVASGGTGAASFGQGWVYSVGGTTALSASTSPTVNYLTATSTTATSTFAAGLQATYLNITGASATSTFARGINIAGGCFAMNGICLSSGLSYVFTYPLVDSAGTISLAFGTTTSNTWAGTQTFNNIVTGSLLATNSTTTTLFSTTASSTSLFSNTATIGSATVGNAALGGGSLAGTFTGSPTFSGVLTLTGTPIFSNGFISNASSSVGDGTQTGGLTIYGGATTTGNLSVTGTTRVGSTFSLASVLSCVGSGALQTDGSGNVSCGTVTAAGSSSGGGWTSNNVGKVSLSTTTDLVVIGASSTPYAKLAVLSGSTATSTLALVPFAGQTANILDIYNTNGTLSSVFTATERFGIGSSSPGARLSIHANPTDSLIHTRLFEIASSTASATTTLFVVQNDGKVGIGTGAPSYPLDVVASRSAASLVRLQNTVNTGASGIEIFNNLNAQQMMLGWGNSSHPDYASTGFIGTTNASPFLFLGAGTERMRIHSDGNVGIGTTNPTTVLEVGGTTTATTFVANDTTYRSTFPYASTTALTASGTGYFGTASTSNLTISNLQSVLLKTGTTGGVIAAVAGTDYVTPAGVSATFPFTTTSNFGAVANSTSTPIWFTAGLMASSTAHLSTVNLDGALNFLATTSTSTISTFAGRTLLTASTTGFNIGLGLDALSNTTSGNTNTALGHQALKAVTSGSGNVAIGNKAGILIANGSSNLALGNFALQSNVSGINNIAIGQTALNLITGSNNIGIGINAGANLTGTVANNIMIGDVRAPSASASDQLNIGNIIFGTNNSGTGSVLSTGQIGIGTTSPYARFAISANNGDANTTLFAIASSTANSTSTLFSISNTGALDVGTSSNQGFHVVNNAATAGNGLSIITSAAGSGVTLQAVSGNSGETLTIQSKNLNPVYIGGSGMPNLIQLTNGQSLFGQTTRSAAATPSFAFFVPTGNPLTASTEATAFMISGNSQTHANGAIVMERQMVLSPMTEAFSSYSANNVITDAATFSILRGPGIADTGNGRITNTYAMLLGSTTPFTTTLFNASTTNSYGLGVFAASGATNNYAATFMFGNVGIGTTSPYANLSIHANSGETNGTLFAIASSTANSTSTLFAVDNTGLVTGLKSSFTNSTTTSLFATTASSTNLFSNASLFGSSTIGSLTTVGTTTGSNGFNIAAGCFAINGACLTSGSSVGFAWTPTTNFAAAANSTSTPIWFVNGLQASSTAHLSTVNLDGALNFLATTSTSTIATFAGQTFLTASTTGFNTGLGLNALANVTNGSSNTAVGRNALLLNTSGSNNIAVGSGALASSTSGSSNTAVGSGALARTTTSFNSALGYQTLSLNTTGQANSVLGYQVLAGGNTSGSFNVGMGYQTLYNSNASNNTAIGYTALFGNTSGNNNVALGYQAGSSVTSGFGNILVGPSPTAGNLSTGAGNIGIGYNTFFQSDTANYQMNIGGILFGALPATSTSFRLPSSGAIGIGTSTPFAKLSISTNAGDTYQNLFLVSSSTANSTSTLFAIDNTGLVTGLKSSFTNSTTTSLFATTASSTNLFSNVATIGSLTAGSLTLSSGGSGVAQLVNGVLSASSTLGIYVGGTNATSQTTNGINFFDGTRITSSSTLSYLGNGSLGLGTSTPWAKLSISQNSTSTDSIFTTLFVISSSTVNSTSTLFTVLNSGNVGIGTSSPYAKLSVVGQVVGDYFDAVSTTSTSTISGGLNVGSGALTYDFSAGITSIQNLALGSTNFEADSGIISWIDMPVTSAASVGTVQSYTAHIDGLPVLTIYSESDGAGDLATSTTRVGIGTSTTPYAKLSVWGSGIGTDQLFELTNVASTTVARFLDNGTGYFSGNIGVGTTTPLANLAIQNTYGSTNANIFSISSSTASTGNTQDSFLSVSSTGFGTTTLSGLNINGSATSTSNVGFNITTGCFAINGTCLVSGSSILGSNNTWTGTNTFNGNVTLTNATSTNFFATLASSTNLFSNTATIGSLTAGSLTLSSGGNGVAQLVNGALSASSTLSVTYGGTGSTTLSGLLKGNGAGAIQTAIAGTDYITPSGLAATFPFTSDTNFTATANSTTTQIWFRAGLQASSTAHLSTLNLNGALNFLATTSTSTISTFAGQTFITASTTGGNTSLGFGALSRITSGLGNTAFGSGALRFATTTSGNTAIGNGALGIYGTDNTVIGAGAGWNWMGDADAASGNRNILLGTNAGGFTGAGNDDNLVAGWSAANNCGATGVCAKNVILGSTAANGNWHGSNVVAIGFDSLGSAYQDVSNSVFIGYQAGASVGAFTVHPINPFNTFVGYQAGISVDDGYGNLLIGAQVADDLYSGSNNIAIGNNAHFRSDSNNQLNIGGILFGALPATSTSFRLPSSGAIGIGTSTPFAKLSISTNAGDTYQNLFLVSSSTANSTSTLFAIDNTGLVTGLKSSFTNSTTTSLFATTASSTNLFSNVATIGSLTAGSLTLSSGGSGVAQLVNGVLSASSTLGIYVGGTNATSQTTNGINFFDGTRITSSSTLSYLGNGSLGLGTTSPFAKLAISGNSNESIFSNLFLISSSTANSTSTLFLVTNTGRVGIGTTTPDAQLTISNFNVASTSDSIFFNITMASSTFSNGFPTSTPNSFFRVSYASSTEIFGKVIDPRWVSEEVKATELAGAISVFVSGNYAYVANFTRDSLAVINISNPADPVFVSEERPGGADGLLNGAISVFVSGNYAYVANSGRSSLAVIDITNPADPVFVSEERPGGAFGLLFGARSVFVSGNYAYVANQTRTSLAVIDISNPADPVFVSEEFGPIPGTSLGAAASVFVSGNYAYVANASRSSLAIIDISNPADPVFVSEERGPTPDTSLSGATSVFVSGNYAYVANSVRHSLAVIDISNPADPVFVSEERGPTPDTSLSGATSVFVSGNYAYVANATRDSLAIIDISNPADPVFVSEERGPTPGTSFDSARFVFVSGNYAYMANFNRASLAVIDVGGASISNAQIGTAKIGNLSVDAFAQFSQGGLFGGGLTAQGSIFGNSGATFSRIGTTTPLASTTLAWGSASVYPALSALVHDASIGGITDVFSLTHTATGTVSAGIGTGILFNDPTWCSLTNCANATTTATTTARIASIFTNVSTATPASALSFSTKGGSTGLTEWMRLTSTGNLGLGTSTPTSTVSIFKQYGTTNDALFTIASSTNAIGSTNIPFLSVSSTGFGTTTLSGLTISGSATSTSNVGFNITTGCFAVNGTCLTSGSGSGGFDFTSDLNFGTLANSTTTPIWFQGGLQASSTAHLSTLNVNGALNFLATTSTSTIATFAGQSFIVASTTGLNVGLGNSALASITSGNNNTAIGDQASLSATSSVKNTVIGSLAYTYSGGSSNTAIGYAAFGSGASYGSNNTMVGDLAGGAGQVNGNYNIGLGSAAYGSGVTGNSNIAIGKTFNAGTVSGSNNVAIGEFAFGYAGAVSGSNNIGIGYAAGAVTTSGYGNIFAGYQSGLTPGYANQTGYNNIAIGYNAYLPSASGNNQISIGNLLFGTLPATSTVIDEASGKLILPTTGAIGIGTSTPWAKFSISTNNGDTQTNLFLISSSTANSTTTLFSVSNTGALTQLGGASSTFSNGININAGCFSVGGTCLTSGGSSASSTLLSDSNTFSGTNIFSGSNSFTGALTLANATSTNFFATLASSTNLYSTGATSSSLFTSYARFTTASSTNLFANTASIGSLTAGSLNLLDQVTNGVSFYNGSAITSSSTFSFLSNGSLGIGTSSPFARLSLWGSNTATSSQVFAVTNSASTTNFAIDNAGFISAGASITGTPSGIFTIDASSSTTTISNLSIGNLVFDTDSGIVNLSDIPVSGAALGVQQAQIINIGGNPILTASGHSNGAGEVTNLGVVIGTSTIPFAMLHVVGASTTANSLAFLVSNYASSTLFNITNAGNVGIGTTTPFAKFSIHANSGETNGTLFAIASSTANSTSTLFSISNTGALDVGTSSNQGFHVVNNAATAGNGLSIITSAAGSGVTLQAVSGNSGETLTIQSKNLNPVYIGGSGMPNLIQLTNGQSLFGQTTRSAAATPSFAFFVPTGNPLTASTEATAFMISGNSQTHANGAIVMERQMVLSPMTEAFSSYSANNVITDAATFSILRGPGIADTGNGRITNTYAMLLGSTTPFTTTLFNASTTNSYGLGVFAASGATNNYAATFMFGNVGIGTTSPYANLSIHANSGETNGTLFAIASSTANSTSTLFLVTNTGNVGIGTSTPNAKLTISNFNVASTSDSIFFDITMASSTFSNGFPTSTPNSFFRVSYASSTEIFGKVIDPRWVSEEQNATTLNGVQSVFVSGNYAYVANNGRHSLAVIDISNPADPVFISEERGPTPGTSLNGARSVFVSGNYAYVANLSRNSLAVIDISNPADPVFVSEERGPTPDTSLQGASSVFVSGNYAYVANQTRNSLAVIDISNPADPVFVSEERGPTPDTSLNGAASVFVSGNYAYVANYGRNSLAVIDISNPADPVFVSEERGPTPDTSLSFAYSVFVSGNYAYVANYGRNSLAVIDISNPADPVFVSEERGPVPGTSLEGAVSVFVSGNYAYMANTSRNSLAVIDISNPADPVFISEERGPISGDSLESASSIFVSGNYAYVANQGRSSLAVIDVGGASISNAQIGTAKIGNLSVDGFAQFSQGASFGGSLGVQGNIFANQGGTFLRMGTTTPLASTTLAWGSASVYPALSALVHDASIGGITDVFSLTHTATGTVSAGIGSGILFNDPTWCSLADCANATTTATSTARIASIFTNVSTSSPASALAFFTKTSSAGLTEWMRLTSTGNLGLGTTTPYAKFAISANSGEINPWLLEVASSTGSATSTHFIVTREGTVGIGTSSPVSTLSIQGSLCVRDTGACGTAAGTIYATTAAISDIDLAENYPTTDLSLAPGEIVALDTSTSTMIKRAVRGDNVLGIVSTAPGLLLGKEVVNGKSVALKGRVPLKVSLEGGDILIGDRVTISSTPGVGMKATTTTRTVGIALEPYSATSTEQSIMVFVQNEITFSDTDRAALAGIVAFASSTDAHVETGSFMDGLLKNILTNVSQWLADAGNNLERIFVKELRAENIFAKNVYAEEKICIDGECLTKDDVRTLIDIARNGQTAGAGGVPPPGGSAGSSDEPSPPSTNSTSSPQTDTKAPVITIHGANPAEIEVGQSYADLGATVTDDVDQNLGIHTFVDGVEVTEITIDTSVAGQHVIRYEATDQAGNTGSAERTVIVAEPAAPTPTPETP